MARYNIPRTALVVIDGVPHKYLGEPLEGYVQLMNVVTGSTYVHVFDDHSRGLLTHAAWDALLLEGRLKVVDTRHGATQLGDADAKDCAEIDPAAPKMLAQCRALDDAGVMNGIKATIDGLEKHWTPELIAIHGPADSPHSVKRWRSQRGTPGQRTLRDMVRQWGRGDRAPYLDDDVAECLQRTAYTKWVNHATYESLTAELGVTIANINAGISREYDKPAVPHPIPSYATVRRACMALECALTTATLDGKQIVDSEWRGAGKPLTSDRALAIAIIDHSPIPGFWVFDPERMMVAGQAWLSIDVDVHSGAIKAHLVTYRPPSFASFIEVIRRSNRPKRPPPFMAERYPGLARLCGKSAEYILDNGVEFRGYGAEDIARGVGFTIRFCPIKKPRYRATGERMFGTIFVRLKECLPGASRPIAWARKAGYDPQNGALVTIDELEAHLNLIIAEINTDPGEDGRPPLLKWEKSVAIHGIDMIHDVEAFGRELLEVKLGVQLTNAGISMFGLRYHDVRTVPELLDDLVRLEPKRQRRETATATVKVKFDPDNISKIHVWNRSARTYVTLRCDDVTYADGMPLWLHEDFRAAARTEGDAFNTEAERMAVRAVRIRAMRNITPEAKHNERLTLARLYEIPRLRAITGNIVHLQTDDPNPVGLDDFIAHDLAAKTALDNEILAPRLSFAEPRRLKTPRREPQAERASPADASSVETGVRRSPGRRVSGSYK